MRDLGTKEALFYVLLGDEDAGHPGGDRASSPTPRRRSASTRRPTRRTSPAAIASGVQGFLGNRDRLAKAN